jgi:hypothetical protein
MDGKLYVSIIENLIQRVETSQRHCIQKRTMRAGCLEPHRNVSLVGQNNSRRSHGNMSRTNMCSVCNPTNENDLEQPSENDEHALQHINVT